MAGRGGKKSRLRQVHIDGSGDMWGRAAAPRLRPAFAPGKLRHVIEAVLQAADHWYVELLTLATQGWG